MFEFRLAFLILLCIPVLVVCIILTSKLVDEALKNRNR
jgi:hypothetical protein